MLSSMPLLTLASDGAAAETLMGVPRIRFFIYVFVGATFSLYLAIAWLSPA